MLGVQDTLERIGNALPGTTGIGKYLLNHSFMIPGLIGVGVSTVTAYLLSRVLCKQEPRGCSGWGVWAKKVSDQLLPG